MTWGKYRRLLAVSAVPLLIAGGIFAMVNLNDQHYAAIRCENAGVFAPNCRRLTYGDPLDTYIENKYPAWFDLKIVKYDENALPFISASGSQMYLEGVEIVSVEAYIGTDESEGSPIAQLRDMASSREPISIIFGVNEDRPGDPRSLGCNELDITEAPSTYVAGLCGVPGGGALVTFRPNAEGAAYLEELHRKAVSQVEEAKSQLMWSYALTIPVFLVLFLLMSLLVWAVRRAVSYVSAG